MILHEISFHSRARSQEIITMVFSEFLREQNRFGGNAPVHRLTTLYEISFHSPARAQEIITMVYSVLWKQNPFGG